MEFIYNIAFTGCVAGGVTLFVSIFFCFFNVVITLKDVEDAPSNDFYILIVYVVPAIMALWYIFFIVFPFIWYFKSEQIIKYLKNNL
jgi:hypothetical protein